MNDKRDFEAALAQMKHGKLAKAKKGRSTVTFVSKARAKRIKGGK